jgi:hypothetical protein
MQPAMLTILCALFIHALTPIGGSAIPAAQSRQRNPGSAIPAAQSRQRNPYGVLRQNRSRAALRRKESAIPSSATQFGANPAAWVIGYEESERLSVAPAHYFVEVTKREKRACPHCPQAVVSTAPAPACTVERGVLSDELVVNLIEKNASTCLCTGRRSRSNAIAAMRQVFRRWATAYCRLELC